MLVELDVVEVVFGVVEEVDVLLPSPRFTESVS